MTMTEFWIDADGNRVDPGDESAVAGEAVETDENGDVIRRYYLVPGPPPDETVVENTDDIERAMFDSSPEYDLALVDGDTTTPVTTIAQLMTYLGAEGLPPDQVRDRVANMLPLWANAPADLKAAVNAYLTGQPSG